MLLHKEKGLNPKMTYCPRCRKETDEIVLLGNRNNVLTCPWCGTRNYGSTTKDSCGACKNSLQSAEVKEIGEFERVPGSLCDECQQELKEFDEEVKKGGIYWRCKCGAMGVIKASSEYAQEVRREAGIPAPSPIGVDLTDCWACRKAES